MTKGFYVEVFRGARGNDCTIGGASSKHSEIFVLCDGVHYKAGPFDLEDAVRKGVPVFVVGVKGGRINLTPKDETRWTMFGGNFAYCCDSRTPNHPVHIHDRIEG
jgi:hypothetical protein